ncbi:MULTISPECIES: MMPL family transporter [unclassified Neptuniibacter]|uniref:efflux RND transporter permease subunit n=1 Tax=unclassified Neptuniibacter TaxID=2630693 RepID=UPI000C3B9162|nr:MULTISPECIES: MMPL family transporter [unclassified Neptuniibacter]MAY41761.1 RND transporter [Oceanospirillaceae bacterium]
MGFKGWLVALSMQKPKQVFLAIFALVVFAGLQIPSIKVDTDPENMLPHDQVDRVFHDEVKKRFSLHDMIVVGVVNTEHEQGVYNPQTLQDLNKLSLAVQTMDGVIRQDLMALNTVDNISQSTDQPGTIRFEWMMKSAPKTQAEADQIKASVENLPLLKNTLVSGDGKAAGVYIPIENKSESYRLSKEIQLVIDELNAASPTSGNSFHMAGLPVAEDTFGVEMFIQMAISAPLAGLMIFVLMWVFFRSMLLITAPMLVAMAAVIITMGLLIGQGYTVHIMSSMIPIFLMPIAVVDSVHILSEFSDRYKPGDKPQSALRSVVGHLFTPMLYTSITSAVGFASLALTPIPPVQIFGLHVAFGILLAFALTVTLVPAYIVSLSPKRLAALKDHSLTDKSEEQSKLGRFLSLAGRFSIAKSKGIILLFVAVGTVSIYGLTTIQINDNPVRWFKEDHRLRIADKVMNSHFSGTYDAFLVLERTGLATQKTEFLGQLESLAIDQPIAEKLKSILIEYRESSNKSWLEKLAFDLDDLAYEDAANESLWLELLSVVEKAQSQSKFFLSPDALNYLEGLQTHLNSSELVGKSNSLVTLLKTVYRELQGGDSSQYLLPKNSAAAAQTILSFQSSHRPDDLWHMVTPDYNATVLWLQLKSGDNQKMSRVIELVDDYVELHPLPINVEMNWAGLTYINVVWQEQMVSGMLNSLTSAFFMVLVMMLLLFRSVKIGLLAMLPLTVTILFIYAVIGFVGKDYDMPIAVLSALTLGLSVDFAIHFLERCRAIYRETGDWPATVDEVYKGPARAISRNAVVIAVGFTPLLFAPLVPYITVGFFLAVIMAVSAVVTVVLLPAVIHQIKDKDRLFSVSGPEPALELELDPEQNQEKENA